MYAVFETGGKQYQVAPGDLVNVEKVEAAIGDKVFFENVLLVKDEGKAPLVGRPHLPQYAIETEVIDQDKHKKIVVFTFTRTKGFHKTKGHRQPYTCVKVLKIKEV